MTNFKKIGLTALAGSLAVTAYAQAGALSVNGTARMEYSTDSTSTTTTDTLAQNSSITFSGSVIAFLKLQGIMSGAPITFKGQHLINAIILISIIVLTYFLCTTQINEFFWILIAVSFLIGFLIILL